LFFGLCLALHRIKGIENKGQSMANRVKTYTVNFTVAGRKSTRVKKILADLGAEQIKVQARPFGHVALARESEDPKTRAVLLQEAASGELSLLEARVLGLLASTETASFHTLQKVVGSAVEVGAALKRLASIGLVERVKLGVYRRVHVDTLVDEIGGRNAKKLRESVARSVGQTEEKAREVWEKLSPRDARLLSSIPPKGPCFATDACALAGIKASRSSFIERLKLKGLIRAFGPPRTQHIELTEAGAKHPQYEARAKKAPVDFGIDRHPQLALDALMIMAGLQEAVAVEVNAVYKRLRPEDRGGAVKMAYLEKQGWVRQVKQPGSARPIYQLTKVGAEFASRTETDLPSAYGIRRLLQQALDVGATAGPRASAGVSATV
jgi:predicted transcriptional regulator